MVKKQNKKRKKATDYFTNEMVRTPWFWVVLALLLILYLFLDKREENEKNQIEQNTTLITSISNIEEWEFLTIRLEELVDTTIEKRIANQRCTKIYKGTARLGINMKKCKKNWVIYDDKDVDITLPSIELIDKNIIDETQTRTFFEEGKISTSVKEKMLSKAKKEMKKKALKKENLATAEQNASIQFKNIFSALGYQNISVKFQKETTAK